MIFIIVIVSAVRDQDQRRCRVAQMRAEQWWGAWLLSVKLESHLCQVLMKHHLLTPPDILNLREKTTIFLTMKVNNHIKNNLLLQWINWRECAKFETNLRFPLKKKNQSAKFSSFVFQLQSVLILCCQGEKWWSSQWHQYQQSYSLS